MDSGHVTFSCESRPFLAVNLCDVVIAIIEGGCQMRGSAARLASTNRAIVDEHNCSARSCKEIGSRHSRDPRADYAHIRSYILCKRLELRDVGGTHPDGGRVTRVALHNFVSRKGLAWRVPA